MLQTVEAMLDPDGNIHLLEKLKVTEPTKVIVTLLNTDTQDQGTGQAVLDSLKNNPIPLENRRSSNEIEQYIQQTRDGWD